MARPRSSQQQADLATQSADPRHTSGDALDQSLEGNDEERSNASPRQETAAASAERHRVNDGSIIDLPVGGFTPQATPRQDHMTCLTVNVHL